MANLTLTLSLEEQVIERMKNLANGKGISLSEYVGEYLQSSFPANTKHTETEGVIPAEILALKGILKKDSLNGSEAGDDKYAYLKEKYDL